MKKLIFIAALAAGIYFSLDRFSVAERPVSTYESKRWMVGAEKYDAALAAAGEHNAALMLYFHADWCGFCERLENDILYQSETKNALQNVVRIRINPESSDANRALAKKFDVNGYPVVLVRYPEMEDYEQVYVDFSQERIKFYKAGGGTAYEAFSPSGFTSAVRKTGL